jgi:hypothetical protein
LQIAQINLPIKIAVLWDNIAMLLAREASDLFPLSVSLMTSAGRGKMDADKEKIIRTEFSKFPRMSLVRASFQCLIYRVHCHALVMKICNKISQMR